MQGDEKEILLRGLPRDFEINSETVMSISLGYQKSVAKLIVQETRIIELEESLEKPWFRIN